jgi:argininosuccinate lyase
MKKLWGGRFAKPQAAQVEEFTQSIDTDARMVFEDIWGSEAHAIMLAAQEIISVADLRQILTWLERARSEFSSGAATLQTAAEDVHMNVEQFVIDGAGIEFGGKLHTARSRNDQVATDVRMRVRAELLDVAEAVLALQGALLDLAERHHDAPMPGFTHVQHAMPITVGFWLTAHAAMLSRDGERLLAAYDRTNRNPLGACALAGTSFPTERRLTTRLLGFDSVMEHALDAVSSRDFAAEALAALALLAANQSRLAQEVIFWSSFEFRLLAVDDAYATGSSIMPQKKNPCVAELTRARTGRAYGALMQMLTLLKDLPSGYNRDLQEDRQALWGAFDNALDSLGVFAGMVGSLTLNLERMRDLAGADFSTAVELANYLVRERGLTFRESHEVVGKVVGALAREGKDFTDRAATKALLSEAGVDVPAEALHALLDIDAALAGYRSLGSTSPAEVARMIADLRAGVARAAHAVAERRGRIDAAQQQTADIVRGVIAGDDLVSLLPAL